MVIKRSLGGESALILAIDQHPVCPTAAPAFTLTSVIRRLQGVHRKPLVDVPSPHLT